MLLGVFPMGCPSALAQQEYLSSFLLDLARLLDLHGIVVVQRFLRRVIQLDSREYPETVRAATRPAWYIVSQVMFSAEFLNFPSVGLSQVLLLSDCGSTTTVSLRVIGKSHDGDGWMRLDGHLGEESGCS